MPRPVRSEAERVLGARIVRGARVYGGYAPSATFRLLLADGRRAFFKGIWSESNKFMHRALEIEERVYRELGERISPWAPAFLGALRRDDWHALLLEDLGPADVPPWGSRKVRSAAHDFARLHQANLEAGAPDWISRDAWQQQADVWTRLGDLEGGLASAAALAGDARRQAEEWLGRSLPALSDAARRVREIQPPYTLLHEDARSDNVRVTGGRLRIFDWNWISLGPLEFDVAAFAEGIAADGGPEPEAFVAAYRDVQSVRRDALSWCVAGFAGYFTAVAWRPPIPQLPRVRDVQRRQMKVCLPWAARLLELPEPTWLAAVPD
ncbi:MAG: hypothetical protein AAB284_00540 [Chloroflexota bacterium]